MKDATNFLNRFRIFLDAVVGADDQLGFDAVEVSTAVGDDAVGRLSTPPGRNDPMIE